jgi:hypothetical protein
MLTIGPGVELVPEQCWDLIAFHTHKFMIFGPASTGKAYPMLMTLRKEFGAKIPAGILAARPSEAHSGVKKL